MKGEYKQIHFSVMVLQENLCYSKDMYAGSKGRGGSLFMLRRA